MLPLIVSHGRLLVPLPRRGTEEEFKNSTITFAPFEMVWIWDKDYCLVIDSDGNPSNPIPLSKEEADALRFLCKEGEYKKKIRNPEINHHEH